MFAILARCPATNDSTLFQVCESEHFGAVRPTKRSNAAEGISLQGYRVFLAFSSPFSSLNPTATSFLNQNPGSPASRTMAKRQPKLTIEEMEEELGYKVDESIYPEEDFRRFFSDLSPIPESLLEKTQVEVKANSKQKKSNSDALIHQALPNPGTSHVSNSNFLETKLSHEEGVKVQSTVCDSHTERSCRLRQFRCRLRVFFWSKAASAFDY